MDMTQRLKTLKARIEEEDELRREDFSHDDVATVLAEQGGHVGKSLIALRQCIRSVLQRNRLVFAVATKSMPTTRTASPRTSPRGQRASRPDSAPAEDSLDLLVTQQRQSRCSSRSSSPRSWLGSSTSLSSSRRPSLVNFTIYNGRLQHPEFLTASRVEEQRVAEERGPGSYGIPIRADQGRTSAPIITPLPTNKPLPPSDSHRSILSPGLMTVELPTPEFAQRLARAHTYTSALRSKLSDHRAVTGSATSRLPTVSSPRKRSYAPMTMDEEATRRSVERLHRGSTSSNRHHNTGRAEQQRRSLQWGSEGRGVLFPAPF